MGKNIKKICVCLAIVVLGMQNSFGETCMQGTSKSITCENNGVIWSCDSYCGIASGTSSDLIYSIECPTLIDMSNPTCATLTCVQHASETVGGCACNTGYHPNTPTTPTSCVANIIYMDYSRGDATTGAPGAYVNSCTYDAYCSLPPANTYTYTNHKFTGWECTKLNSGPDTDKSCDNVTNPVSSAIKKPNIGCNTSSCTNYGIKLTAQWEACKKTGIEDNAFSYDSNCYITACNDGYYVKNKGQSTSTCTPCDKGKYCNGDETSTTDCPKGWYCPGGKRVPCPAGHTTKTENAGDKGAEKICRCTMIGIGGSLTCTTSDKSGCTRFCDLSGCFYLSIDEVA
jgi:hypothetical protein